MKALVFAEPRRAVVETSTCPRIAADEVLVRSRNVGICHSDFELYEGRYIIPVSYPIIPGHEWAGEIAEVGRGGERLRPGDRVVGECVVNNGDDHFGFSISGADAEYFVAKASWLHRMPEELSFAQGAFVEPFSVAYSAAVAAGGIDASDEVAVIGGGPIGLLCVMAAATMGGRGDADRAAGAPPRARPRGRRDAGDRPGRRAAARAGAGGHRRPWLRRRHRGRRRARRDGERAPDRRAQRARRARRHRRRRLRAGRDRARAVEGAAGARHHRLGRAVAAHDPLHGHERPRHVGAADGQLPARRRDAALDAARDTSRNVKVQIEC